ncbi:MAG: molybdopterin-dependent oxidoreductase [Chitinispirillaceae bacterium]|nr:molybdopterin-dependent oxidoreductase [Chitinispirillaceae bacterium]
MKKIVHITIMAWATAVVIQCANDKSGVVYNWGTNGPVDVTTMATPDGGRVKAAEEGPVRSAFDEPAIDLSTFCLEVTGLVDSPFILTWEEILAHPAAYSDTILMYCVEGWEVWGNWKGILIRSLLERAHVQTEGNHILFGCADGYSTSLPISYLLKYDIILAYEVNGSPLQGYDGFPLRLIAFGKYGYKWAKWITRLEVTAQSETGFWEGRGYTDKADVPISRRQYYEGEAAELLEY